MATVEKLMKRRNILRASMKRFADLELSLVTVDEIKAKLVGLRKLEVDMEKLEATLFDELLETADEETCSKEQWDAIEFFEKITVLKIKMEDMVKMAPTTLSSSSDQGQSNIVKDTTLPKLKLEIFDLNPSNYLSFWAQFERIHSTESLEREVKFQYLKMCLTGPSKLLVDSYPVTSENYAKALEHLKQRYGRKDLIVNVLYKQLLVLVKKKLPITELFDCINCKIKSLETLGITTEMTAILTPLIEECLPSDLRLLWERKEIGEDVNRLDHLLLFLAKEAETFERLKDVEISPAERRDVCSSTAATLVASKRNNRNILECAFCKGEHRNNNCKTEMSPIKRRDIAKTSKLCFRCLSPGHAVAQCKNKITCSICGGRHYRLVCVGKPVSSPSSSLFVSSESKEVIMLQTVLGKVNGKIVRIMLDTGSHRSYISSRICEGLKKVGSERFGHALFGGRISEEINHDVYNITLSSLDGKQSFSFNGCKQQVICGKIPSYPHVFKKLRDAGISMSDDGKNRPIDILLGADVMFRFIIGVKSIGTLLAFETPLGWCVMGTTTLNTSERKLNVVASMLSCKLPNLWELEPLGIQNPEKINDDGCIAHFQKHVRLEKGGHYSVALPWIENHPPIPNNFLVAEARLQSTLKQLYRKGLYSAYDKVFHDWQDNGIIEEVDMNDIVGHYLPHRPVIKDSKKTKIRPVFDASAKTVGYVSLNECLNTGPNLMSHILPLLLRFRLNEVGITADIRQAFLMIKLNVPADRDMLRFLWWRDGKLITFRHLRVVFGLAPSPFLLNMTLLHHLSQFTCLTAKTLRKAFYVDDCVTSLSSSNVGSFREEATAILAKGNFDLRGWITSGDDTIHSVLGVNWIVGNDRIHCLKPRVDDELTKKSLLAIIGRVYDPLGILSAPMLYMKLILQECYKLKCSWFDPLPDELARRANKWLAEIDLIENISLPRCLKKQQAKHVQLHVFCDASKAGVGCCVYLRSEIDNVINVSWVAGKSRVSPVSPVTIPRMELIGATVGARLGKLVKDALEVNDIIFWTDSMVSLYWIKGGHWKTWVGNRVKEIRQLTDPSTWRFVPGNVNPADLLSRGCLLGEFAEWQGREGPLWLYEPEKTWPNVEIFETTEALNEQKILVCNLCNTPDEPCTNLFNYFSSFKTNVRLMAWICRFIEKTRKRSHVVGKLSADEIIIAEEKLLAYIQRVWPPNVENIKTELDETGNIRIATKVLSDQFASSFRKPLVLADGPLVQAMIREKHVDMHHIGAGWLLNELRKKVWILKGRKIARKIIRNCVKCRRHRAKPFVTPPTGLPDARVNLGKVFQVAGCDLMGPLHLRAGDKVYIVIFTCAVYRAVHLEMVTSLSTEDFLMALRRMMARRGRISHLISDNGTNFVGAFNNINKYAVEAIKIKWSFNVPTGSWWGGFFERLIGVIKMLLKASLGRALLTYDELQTIVVEIESVMNKRPITYLSDVTTEPMPITPAMFLQQEELETTTLDLDSVDKNSLTSRVRYVNSIRCALKERFTFEYLGSLVIHCNKLKGNKDCIKVGSVVWIENDKKRINWELGKVIEVFPGKDQVTRVVKLKTAKGEILRPVQRLYLMEGLDSTNLPDSYISNDLTHSDFEGAPDVAINDNDDDGTEKRNDGQTLRSSSGRIVKRPDRLNL